MLREVVLSATLSMVGLVAGSVWMGPEYGPKVRSVGWKLVVVGAIALAVLTLRGDG